MWRRRAAWPFTNCCENTDGYLSRNLLFFGSDPQRLHFAVKIAALETEQFSGARYVPVGLFELLEDVIALHGFSHFLQTAEVLGALGPGPPRGLQRNVPRIDAHLRVQDHDALDQVP